MTRIRANANGFVRLPIAELTRIALPSDLAQRHVNYIVRAYASDAPPTEAGTYPVDTAYVGFVLDTVTGLPTTTPTPDGATYTMRQRSLAFADPTRSCAVLRQGASDNYATCEQHTYFDADLQSVKIPFVTNYGGGTDWASTITVETSKEVKTEWMIKAGADEWGKGEGKLTTSETGRSTVSTPESPRVGNTHLGRSIDQDQDWQFVRETSEVCVFVHLFCTNDEIVRPYEWTGGIIPHPVQVPSYPYDQAGEPGFDNFNCTRRYEMPVVITHGHDEELGTTLMFGASGGFRDEISIEAEWSVSTTQTSDLSHAYYIVDDSQPMHFLFVPGGLNVGYVDAEPRCAEDDIAHAFSDADSHDLTNVGLGETPDPNPKAIDVCKPEVPAQIRNLLCP
ncbi:MAG: hypothetical protein QOE45_96 [Frankiaceae bacterium]|nr:hypothetical protein [Frankiaceae bacterium]